MGEATREFPDFELTRSWEMDFPPVAEGDEDLETYLKRAGFTEAQLDYTQRGFAGATAEAMRNISAESAIMDMQDDTWSTGDYRILEGYNSIHEFLSMGLNIHLNTVVETIAWDANGVQVHTTDGQTYVADYAVITLPLGVLQAGNVRFDPALPAEKQAAIKALRMGPVIKMVYRFDEPPLPEGKMALYSALNPCMWWSPSFGQPLAKSHVITAFVTADRARELLAMSEDEALETGVKVLRQELDRPDLRPTAMKMVDWVADPFSLGGYSVTTPGHSAAHQQLALPVDGRLFWAGEATAHTTWTATVHGAYDSGKRVAAEIGGLSG
jgi:monoamine oxidase